MKNYYEVLDLSHDASEEMIKKRYRQLSFMNHPDRYFSLDDPDLKAFAEEKFKEINEAYGVLGKPKKRANYDKQFHSGKSRYQEPDTKPRGGYQEPDTSWQDDYHSPQWNQVLVSLLVMINQMIKQGKWRNAKEALYVFGGLGYRPKWQPPIGLIDRNHPKWQIALKLNKAANSSIILPVITLLLASGIGYSILGAITGIFYFYNQNPHENILGPVLLASGLAGIAGLIGSIYYLLVHAGRHGFVADLILGNLGGLVIISMAFLIWIVIVVMLIGFAIKVIWDSEMNR